MAQVFTSETYNHTIISDGELIDPDDLTNHQLRSQRLMGHLLDQLMIQPGVEAGDTFRPVRAAMHPTGNDVDMTVTVGAGPVVGTSGGVNADPTPDVFLHHFEGQDIQVDAAHATLDRIDILSASLVFDGAPLTETRVFKDQAVGIITAQPLTMKLGRTRLIVTYTPGVPAATPVDPSTPAGEVMFARIFVAAGDAILSSRDIHDHRRPASLTTHVVDLGSATAFGAWAYAGNGILYLPADGDEALLSLSTPGSIHRRLKNVVFSGRLNTGAQFALYRRLNNGMWLQLEDVTGQITLDSLGTFTIEPVAPWWANTRWNVSDPTMSGDGSIVASIVAGAGANQVINGLTVNYWGD